MHTEQVYLENVNLIHKIANKYKSWAYTQGITYDELISVGSLAFMVAVNNYKIRLGVKFSTYLYSVVDDHMKTEILRSSKSIDVPMYIKKYSMVVRNEGNDKCSKKDLILIYGITDSVAEGIHTYLNEGLTSVPLNDYLSDYVLASDSAKLDEGVTEIIDWISTLNEDDKELVVGKIYGKTSSVLAKERGVSAMAVSKRLAKLKRSLYYSLEEEYNEAVH